MARISFGRMQRIDRVSVDVAGGTPALAHQERQR
jgi:hypothetical protein